MESIVSVLYQEIKKSIGFPVAAIIVDKLGNIIVSSSNSRYKKKKNLTDHKNHAEFKLLTHKLYSYKGKLTLYVTFPPCSDCLKAISKRNKIDKIIYLFDLWGKTKKQYIKQVKGIEIKLIDFNNQEIDYMWDRIIERYNKPSHKDSRNRLNELHNS